MSTVSCAYLTMKPFKLETRLWVTSFNNSLIGFLFIFSPLCISGALFWIVSPIFLYFLSYFPLFCFLVLLSREFA